jgi:hypothetical protein
MIGPYLSYQNSAREKNSTETEPIFGSAMPQNLGLRCEAKLFVRQSKKTRTKKPVFS